MTSTAMENEDSEGIDGADATTVDSASAEAPADGDNASTEDSASAEEPAGGDDASIEDSASAEAAEEEPKKSSGDPRVKGTGSAAPPDPDPKVDPNKNEVRPSGRTPRRGGGGGGGADSGTKGTGSAG